MVASLAFVALCTLFSCKCFVLFSFVTHLLTARLCNSTCKQHLSRGGGASYTEKDHLLTTKKKGIFRLLLSCIWMNTSTLLYSAIKVLLLFELTKTCRSLYLATKVLISLTQHCSRSILNNYRMCLHKPSNYFLQLILYTIFGDSV